MNPKQNNYQEDYTHANQFKMLETKHEKKILKASRE